MEFPESPWTLFAAWYDEALARDVPEPSWTALATATSDGFPSVRIVLLKNYDENGFVFYTNKESRKGRELLENPRAALCFFWEFAGRQVRIEGDVEEASSDESDRYFQTRARQSRLGAWASKQSRPMEVEDALVKRIEEFADVYRGQDVPRPPHWGGFRLVPRAMEFWREGQYRLHERIRYTQKDDVWKTELLYP